MFIFFGKIFKRIFLCVIVIRSKKGAYFFLIDVFLVVLIFFITAMTILSFKSSDRSLSGIDQHLDTLTYELFNVELRDYDSSIVNALRSPSGIVYEENWNSQLTIDELVVLLIDNGHDDNASDLIEEAVGTLPAKYGFNYSINQAGSYVQVYFRAGLIPLSSSAVKLSQRKISWPRSNLTDAYQPAITEVSLWH